MQLFYTKRSPFARKIRLMIWEKALDHQVELIEEDLSNKSQSLVNTNPLGQVPTLLLEDGSAFYDSPVIAQYIDLLNETPRLIPASGLNRFNVLRIEALADGMAEAAIFSYMEHKRTVGKRSEVIDKQLKLLFRCTDALEKDTFFHNSFLSLAHLSVAAALGYIDFRIPDLGWRDGHDKLAEWFDGFEGRASMKKTIPIE